MPNLSKNNNVQLDVDVISLHYSQQSKSESKISKKSDKTKPHSNQINSNMFLSLQNALLPIKKIFRFNNFNKNEVILDKSTSIEKNYNKN